MSDTITSQAVDALVALARLVRATGYVFVSPTPATHARVLARPGSGWAHDLRGVFGWSQPFRPETVPSTILDAMHAASVLLPVGEGWRSTVRLSTLADELFLHSAYPTTASDAVFFGPDTYRFAQAIETALDRPLRRAVDVGCGAGPGAVMVARARPACEVFGVDINEAALQLARANAVLAGVTVRFCLSDILGGLDGSFDLIVANPPYMADPGRRAYRDGGGPLGADLSVRIVKAARERLAPGGTLMLYTGAAILHGRDPFRDAVAPLLDGWRWRYREIDPDVFGEELEGGPYAAADRIAAVSLTAHKP